MYEQDLCSCVVGASLSEPQGVMLSTALVCVHAYLCTCRLGLPGNECSLGSDGGLRTSAEGQRVRLTAQRGSDHHREEFCP